ncbi:alpha/beta hydrolase [Undibacterium sp. Jales W-56]|uniref:alpha/beta fold hydrolase n=1 Tax=Undibacterium sp. Jales W-56 TaxID=2897325 RepID=UPI0021D0F6A3|nr:alpha/beta hydrolase [Undibacterium sp. Jales W-56]MCU6435434.1 alpha/beta hydrolase [Undibacterium sp. Jales W-56]
MPIDSAKPVVHFAHANSFPAGTYRVFFDFLRPHYDIQALPLHGHNPAYPVTDGWPHLVQELIDTLTARYQEPVILLGHSLGGILSMMVAKARPDLVRCVVTLDSPLVGGWRAMMLRWFKFIGLDKKFSPARFSEKRRNQWNDAEEAYRHFASKEMFAIWPPEVLRDYIQAGIKANESGEGVTLRFTREIETAIYSTLPDGLGYLARKGLKVPIGFVGGTESVECRQAGLAATRKLVGENFVQIVAGHLLPMEVPEQAAAATHAMIQSLINTK